MRKYLRFVSQSVLGMLGLSVYILADTFFIANYIGADGLASLNLALPENTEETKTTLKTEITRGNMQLEICLNKINGSYEIAKWRCTARWQPDDSLNLG